MDKGCLSEKIIVVVNFGVVAFAGPGKVVKLTLLLRLDWRTLWQANPAGWSKPGLFIAPNNSMG
jgi:hypothetical protein